MRGWWSALGSVATKRAGFLKAAWLWLVEVPGMKEAATGEAPVAGASSSMHGLLAVSPEEIMATFAGNESSSCQPQLPPGPLQIYDVDSIIFPPADAPPGIQGWFHLSWVPVARNLRTSSSSMEHQELGTLCAFSLSYKWESKTILIWSSPWQYDYGIRNILKGEHPLQRGRAELEEARVGGMEEENGGT